ncbi:hypothetical protein OUZ56_009541 [Daphnia magna]|uniref:Uncharacterized protein n=1 Tax=Daphnia magna TaxID=35525 RepID=A0ABR0AGA3_9CRUS|nr:hypothetical protein OUZ56_009541 [Daphnia magna]
MQFHWSGWKLSEAIDMVTVFDFASASILSWTLGSSTSGVESGHLVSSSFSHDGPFHHSSECTSITAGAPREARSVGFWTPGQCRHQFGPESFLIASTWFLTNSFHLLVSLRIQPSATRESAQNIVRHDSMWVHRHRHSPPTAKILIRRTR